MPTSGSTLFTHPQESIQVTPLKGELRLCLSCPMTLLVSHYCTVKVLIHYKYHYRYHENCHLQSVNCDSNKLFPVILKSWNLPFSHLNKLCRQYLLCQSNAAFCQVISFGKSTAAAHLKPEVLSSHFKFSTDHISVNCTLMFMRFWSYFSQF